MYTALFGLSGLNIRGEEECVSKKERYYYVGIGIVSFMLILLSMWLFWTPISSIVIEGVQGRYFIPVLLLIVLLLKNKILIINKDISRYILLTSYLITVANCFGIWMRC